MTQSYPLITQYLMILSIISIALVLLGILITLIMGITLLLRLMPVRRRATESKDANPGAWKSLMKTLGIDNTPNETQNDKEKVPDEELDLEDYIKKHPGTVIAP